MITQREALIEGFARACMAVYGLAGYETTSAAIEHAEGVACELSDASIMEAGGLRFLTRVQNDNR